MDNKERDAEQIAGRFAEPAAPVSPEPPRCRIIWCGMPETHKIHTDPRNGRFHKFEREAQPVSAHQGPSCTVCGKPMRPAYICDCGSLSDCTSEPVSAKPELGEFEKWADSARLSEQTANSKLGIAKLAYNAGYAASQSLSAKTRL